MAIAPHREAPPRASMAHAGLPRTDAGGTDAGLGATALLVQFLRKVLLGCTQDELSTRSGVHPRLISRYENGKVRPSRNLDLLLGAAGVLELEQPLLLAFDRLSALLSPPPSSPAPSDADPMRLRDLLDRTSRALLQLQSRPDDRLLTGEYIHPVRRDLAATALLTRFLRQILLDCTQDQLSQRTGIHKELISRYERGLVGRPSRRNLDRLLAEARVLRLREPLLLMMSDLSTLLSRPPQPAKTEKTAKNPAGPLLSPDQVEAFLAFSTELIHRTWEKLLFPEPAPERFQEE